MAASDEWSVHRVAAKTVAGCLAAAYWIYVQVLIVSPSSLPEALPNDTLDLLLITLPLSLFWMLLPFPLAFACALASPLGLDLPDPPVSDLTLNVLIFGILSAGPNAVFIYLWLSGLLGPKELTAISLDDT